MGHNLTNFLTMNLQGEIHELYQWNEVHPLVCVFDHCPAVFNSFWISPFQSLRINRTHYQFCVAGSTITGWSWIRCVWIDYKKNPGNGSPLPGYYWTEYSQHSSPLYCHLLDSPSHKFCLMSRVFWVMNATFAMYHPSGLQSLPEHLTSQRNFPP